MIRENKDENPSRLKGNDKTIELEFRINMSDWIENKIATDVGSVLLEAKMNRSNRHWHYSSKHSIKKTFHLDYNHRFQYNHCSSTPPVTHGCPSVLLRVFARVLLEATLLPTSPLTPIPPPLPTVYRPGIFPSHWFLLITSTLGKSSHTYGLDNLLID